MRIERAVLLIALLLAGLRGAYADDDRKDPDVAAAQAHVARGRAHYDAGEFDKALVEFEAAHKRAPRPRLYYHLARTHRALGHNEQALELFQKYVVSEPDGPVVGDAKQQIVELTELVVKPPAPPIEKLAESPIEKPSPPIERPNPQIDRPIDRPRKRIPNWVWLAASAAAVGAGLALDFVPGSAGNRRLDALDLVPIGLYGAAAVGVVVVVF